MKIDAGLVAKLAELARLELDEDEVRRYVGQLEGILGRFEELAALDVSGLEPTMHAVENVGGLRPDEPRPSLPREKVLENAPDPYAGAFRVPRVM